MVLQGSSKDKWIHSEDTILKGKATYNVKFIGVVEVDDPRGMDVVVHAMQKLKFGRHIKRSEGTKPPKVEFSINVDGLQIVDQRTKTMLHDIPLHRVSFCADDKHDKRLFSFIAKGSDGKHYCYGLDSVHEANSITLTIGQAFELGYDKFLKADKAITSKQVIELSRRVESLEKENASLKQKIKQLESTQQENAALSPLLQPILQSSLLSNLSSTTLPSSTTHSTPTSCVLSDLFCMETTSQPNSAQSYLKTQQEAQIKNFQNPPIDIEFQTISFPEKEKSFCDNRIENVFGEESKRLSYSSSRLESTFTAAAPSAELLLDIENNSTASQSHLPCSSPQCEVNNLSNDELIQNKNIIKRNDSDKVLNMVEDSNRLQKCFATFEKKDSNNFQLNTKDITKSLDNLPETEIGDFNDLGLAHISMSKNQESSPSTLMPPSLFSSPQPPKKTTNLYETLSGQSFGSWITTDCSSIFDPFLNEALSNNSNSKKENLIELKSANKIAKQQEESAKITSTYDSVWKLMEALRSSESLSFVLDEKLQKGNEDQNNSLFEKNLIYGVKETERERDVESRLFAFQDAMPTRVHCNSNNYYDVINSKLFHSQKHQPGFREKLYLQSPPATSKKDVFDMQPFSPPPTTPTMVRIPSPKDVHPKRSSSRRSHSNSNSQSLISDSRNSAGIESRSPRSEKHPGQSFNFDPSPSSWDTFDPFKSLQ